MASIDGVQGIKYTALTHFEIQRIEQELGEDFMVYSGSDEMAISGLTFGSDGIIGSFYNVIPELFLDLYRQFKAGNIQAAIIQQEKANRIILKAVEYDYIALMKRMLAWSGVDAGYSRKPFTNYSGEMEQKIRAQFKVMRDEHHLTDVQFMKSL